MVVLVNDLNGVRDRVDLEGVTDRNSLSMTSDDIDRSGVKLTMLVSIMSPRDSMAAGGISGVNEAAAISAFSALAILICTGPHTESVAMLASRLRVVIACTEGVVEVAAMFAPS